MTQPLRTLTADEVQALLALSRKYKRRFAYVAAELEAVADDCGIPERIARLAVASECLHLAATYSDSPLHSFLTSAREAFEWAAAKRKEAATS